MERTKDVTGYVGLACFCGTTSQCDVHRPVGISAYGGAVSWDDWFSSTLAWWVPNAYGRTGGHAPGSSSLKATPSSIRWNARLIFEAVICGAGLVGGTLVSFNSWFVYGIQNYPLAYMPFPFLVWGALRFGPRGATAGTLLVSALAIVSLIRGVGPFVAHTQQESLMVMGSYQRILAVSNT